MTAAGNDSLTTAAEWCQRAAPEELAAFGLPYDVLRGRFRIPSEKTLRRVLGLLDPAEVGAAGFAYLAPILHQATSAPAARTRGLIEREQRRAHRQALDSDRPTPKRRAYAVDGKCLRGAHRPDGSRVFVLSAVRHGDGITLASREIGAKTNEIPELQPLLDQIADTDLTGAVITVDALPAQRAHAHYLVEQRDAHYLFTVKANQRKLAAQLVGLPWKDVPVIHRDDHDPHDAHGRREQRHVQVVAVDALPFPHARQVLRINPQAPQGRDETVVHRDRLRDHRPARRASRRRRDRLLGSRTLDRGKHCPLVPRRHLQRGPLERPVRILRLRACRVAS
ncbi:hypothetical protein SAMN05442782_10964 [Streptomyces sp. OK228]|nr:hypothetical protein SAMN05442782_10964 [Streptomyces sp. OK228]